MPIWSRMRWKPRAFRHSLPANTSPARLAKLPAMDYIAVMVPESSLATAQGIVGGVEAQLSEARLAIQDHDLPDDPLTVLC